MNQHDQMRELLKEARQIIREVAPRHSLNDFDSRVEQALAAEPAKLLPEEFLRIRRQLEAEWAILKQLQEAQRKLVRLTKQDIEKLQHGDITCWNWDDAVVFANAIMDAMERVNK